MCLSGNQSRKAGRERKPVGTTADAQHGGYIGDPLEDSSKLLGDSLGCTQMSTDPGRQSNPASDPSQVRSQGPHGDEGERGLSGRAWPGSPASQMGTKHSGSRSSDALWGPAKSICYREAQVSHQASC